MVGDQETFLDGALAAPREGQTRAAEAHAPLALSSPASLVALTWQIRPDFLLGSMASGLDPAKESRSPLADFFVRNFNIMTVGVYMSALQRRLARRAPVFSTPLRKL
jgi:hypothetical protein